MATKLAVLGVVLQYYHVNQCYISEMMLALTCKHLYKRVQYRSTIMQKIHYSSIMYLVAAAISEYIGLIKYMTEQWNIPAPSYLMIEYARNVLDSNKNMSLSVIKYMHQQLAIDFSPEVIKYMLIGGYHDCFNYAISSDKIIQQSLFERMMHFIKRDFVSVASTSRALTSVQQIPRSRKSPAALHVWPSIPQFNIINAANISTIDRVRRIAVCCNSYRHTYRSDMDIMALYYCAYTGDTRPIFAMAATYTQGIIDELLIDGGANETFLYKTIDAIVQKQPEILLGYSLTSIVSSYRPLCSAYLSNKIHAMYPHSLHDYCSYCG